MLRNQHTTCAVPFCMLNLLTEYQQEIFGCVVF